MTSQSTSQQSPPAAGGSRDRVRKLLRTAFLGGLVLVSVLSLLPPAVIEPVHIWDKAAHASAYAALALVGGFGFPGRRALLRIGLGLLLLSGALEIAQAAVPGRETSAADMLANLIGIVVGSLLVLGARAYRSRRPGMVES